MNHLSHDAPRVSEPPPTEVNAMCERLPGESRLDMLGRLYTRAQMRADLAQLRCQQAEARAIKAERVADRALAALAAVDREAAAMLEMEAAL